MEYVDSKEHPLLQIVRTHQHNKFNSVTDSYEPQQRTTDRNKTNKGRHKREDKSMARERRHGQFPRSLDEQVVGQEQSYRWLKFGDVKGETGSRIVVAQDQAVNTNCLKSKMSEEEIDK